MLVTHRRSGTHLTIDLLRRQFEAFDAPKRRGESLDTLYLSLDLLTFKRRRLSEEQALARLRRARRPIVKTHELPGFDALRPRHAAFVDALLADADLYAVQRDGRDVLCSLHRYMQAYNPRTRCPLAEFMRQEQDGMSRPRYWAHHVRAWRGVPGVRWLAYEEIVAQPGAVLERLARELGLAPRRVEPLLPRPLRSRWQGRAVRLFSRRPAATTILGATGARSDWRTDLHAEDRAFFQRESGDLLVELGYEDSDAWVDDAPEEKAAAGVRA